MLNTRILSIALAATILVSSVGGAFAATAADAAADKAKETVKAAVLTKEQIKDIQMACKKDHKDDKEAYKNCVKDQKDAQAKKDDAAK